MINYSVLDTDDIAEFPNQLLYARTICSTIDLCNCKILVTKQLSVCILIVLSLNSVYRVYLTPFRLLSNFVQDCVRKRPLPRASEVAWGSEWWELGNCFHLFASRNSRILYSQLLLFAIYCIFTHIRATRHYKKKIDNVVLRRKCLISLAIIISHKFLQFSLSVINESDSDEETNNILMARYRRKLRGARKKPLRIEDYMERTVQSLTATNFASIFA